MTRAVAHIGAAAVKTHVHRIFAKTGCRDRATAAQKAHGHGVADSARPAGRLNA